MSQPYYRPRFQKQLTGTVCGHANCNMAAASRYAARETLGRVDPTSDAMRTLSGTAGECVDADKTNDGTTMADAATALAAIGIHTEIERDLNVSDVFNMLDAGHAAIAHIDYEVVPAPLYSGDREFRGLHSVYFNEHDRTNARTLCYDALDDARPDMPTGKIAPQGPLWWPDWLVTRALQSYPGPAVMAMFTTRRRLRTARGVPTARIRQKPTTASPIIGRLYSTSPTLDHGGSEPGQRINGDARWFRVWVPKLARIGYMHASVVHSA